MSGGVGRERRRVEGEQKIHYLVAGDQRRPSLVTGGDGGGVP